MTDVYILSDCRCKKQVGGVIVCLTLQHNMLIHTGDMLLTGILWSSNNLHSGGTSLDKLNDLAPYLESRNRLIEDYKLCIQQYILSCTVHTATHHATSRHLQQVKLTASSNHYLLVECFLQTHTDFLSDMPQFVSECSHGPFKHILKTEKYPHGCQQSQNIQWKQKQQTRWMEEGRNNTTT